jgi:predicted aconitase with swiveling domain
MANRIKGCGVVGGRARGEVLVSRQAISFWGGVDPASGRINDPRNDLCGRSVAGRVLAFPIGKGSSTGSLIILELARIERAPAAIVNIRTEPILATGPIVSRHFYGRSIPMITLTAEDFGHLQTGQTVTVDGDGGWVEIC